MRITTVSPSRLKTAKDCQFKYFLSYQWGWGDELFLYTFASNFGTSVHNTLEEYANAKGDLDYREEFIRQLGLQNPFIEDMNSAPSKARASFFKDKSCSTCPFFKEGGCTLRANESVDDFEGCPRELFDQGIEMIEVAIDRYGKYFETGIKSEENPTGKVIGVEAPATIVWGQGPDGEDIKMNGFIDLVIEYDEETLMVVDYKTGYSVPSMEDFVSDLQPRMYSYAAKEMWPNYKYYWVQFDYFRGIPMETAFTAADDELTRQEVVGMYHDIKQATTIKRRGYDRKCKYLCNRPFCDRKWEELKAGVDGRSDAQKEKDAKGTTQKIGEKPK